MDGMTQRSSNGAYDPTSIRRLRMRFTGEVQGVGFRWTARRIAQDLGLTGWVRNEYDGSVRMELQGPAADMSCYFTLFDRSYAHYPIRYVIDEKDEIEPVPDETTFLVRF